MRTDVTRFTIGFLVLGGLLVLLGVTGVRNRLLMRQATKVVRPTRTKAGEELFLAEVKDLFPEEDGAVVLLEAAGHPQPYLVIGIGMREAHAIKLALSHQMTPRPLTHDLLMRVTHVLGGEVKRLVIDKLEGRVYLGTLYVVDSDGREAAVDTRPSDGIAVALRAGAPIYINGEVLDNAGHSRMQEPPSAVEPDMVEQTLRDL